MSSTHHPTTTPSPPVSDEDKPTPPPMPDRSPNPPPTRTPVFPSREDCWSEEATRTLIEAWGSHYLELNRGNLRQTHWQEVADAVNAVHPKPHRTDVQCKNRIDTTKKKYKIEKSKLLQSNGTYVPTWPHFHSLDSLIGDTFNNNTSSGKATTSVNNNSTSSIGRALRRRVSRSPEYSPDETETTTHHRKLDKGPTFGGQVLRLPWTVPVGPRSKRAGTGSVTERNFSVMAAAAAAMEAEEDEDDDDDDEDDEEDYGVVGRKRRRRRRKGEVEEEGLGEAGGGGYRRLAEAISRLGEIYEKVEEAKQRQMVELVKQRMQFAKDLEIQRMKVFMESQVQLEKLRRSRHNSDANSYL